MEKIIGHVEYEILETIAEGGMGRIVKALIKGTNGFEKVVAIKMILKRYSKDKRFIEHFVDEAKLVANLVHENIIQIYQLDKYLNEYYFIMEYVDGINLFDFMEFLHKSRRRLPVKMAVFIVANVARALAYAHSRCGDDGKSLNIIHCDVCSHNIMINTEGVVKLTDFGVARAVTMRGTSVSGKLPFMSPEQCNRSSLDFHSDIYSLGIVLFYMLSGGKSCRHLNVKPSEIISQAQHNYIDWDLLPNNLNQELLVILRRMLSAEPEKRYSSSSKVAKKLEQYISQNGCTLSMVSLAKYMRREMPALFANVPESPEDENEITKTPPLGTDDLTLESGTRFDQVKTRHMTKEELAKSAVLKSKWM